MTHLSSILSLVQFLYRAAAANLSFGGRMIGLGAMWLCLSLSPLAAQNPTDSLYSAMRGAQDPKEKARLLLSLVDQRKYVDNDSPKVWALELLEIGVSLKDQGIESDALSQLAWIYRTHGNHSEGITYAGQAIQKAEQIQDRLRIANALLEVGLIQREQSHYPEAESSLRRGLAAYEAENDLLGQGRCMNALGEVARLQQKYGEARDAYERTRELYIQTQYHQGILVVQNNLGLILEAEGKYQEALDSLSRSGSGAAAINFTGLFLESTDAMARCLLKLGQFKEAEDRGKTAFDAATQSGHKKYASSSAKTLSEVYAAQNNLPMAMAFQRKHFEIAREIVNESSRNRIESLNFDLELRQKEAEIEVLNKNRQIRQLWSLLAVFAFGLICIVGIVLLISYRRKHQHNKVLASQNDVLADLVLEKDSLINIVAHDLKSPIAKTQGLVALLADTGEFNPQQAQIAAMIDKVLKDGDRLIRDLLDISQAEGNQSSLSPTRFDLDALLSSLIASNRESANKKRITLSYTAPAAALSVHTDESFVARVFDNLLSNAIKYSPANTSVQIQCGRLKDHVWFSVKDEGPGFSPEDQEKMYRKFQRLSARPTGGESSNGLGLSIIRLLVTQLQGQVRLQSELGKGSTFVVEFPAQLV